MHTNTTHFCTHLSNYFNWKLITQLHFKSAQKSINNITTLKGCKIIYSKKNIEIESLYLV